MRAAKRINAEGERIVDKANEEADRIVSRAQEQAAFLIGERGLTEAAEDESRRIVAQAEADGEEVRRGADEYAIKILLTLEAEVVKALSGIRKGIGVLDERRGELEEPAGPGDGTDEEEDAAGHGVDVDAEGDEDRLGRPVYR